MDLSIGCNGMHHVWMTDSSLCMNVNLDMWWNGLKWIVFEPDTLFKKNKAWLHELWIRSERGELPKNPKKLRGHTNCLQMFAALRPSSALQPAHEVPVVLFGHLNLSIKLVFFLLPTPQTEIHSPARPLVLLGAWHALHLLVESPNEKGSRIWKLRPGNPLALQVFRVLKAPWFSSSIA